MTYLWASAAVRVNNWAPALTGSSVQYLADRAAWHLEHAERFTLYLDWRYGRNSRPYLTERSARNAERGACYFTTTVRLLHPGLSFRAEIVHLNRLSMAVRLVPREEWHPAGQAGEPATVVCDGSAGGHGVRAGIVWDDLTAAVDLEATGVTSSAQAEFLTLCLALLAGVGERRALTVCSDETSAVAAADLLAEGLLPHWIYLHPSENTLALRIAITAMAAVRVRPVRIKHVSRRRVAAAHDAAYESRPNGSLWSPRTFAARQGIRIGWYDHEHGLDLAGTNVP